MGLLDNDTSWDPLCLENLTGLDADIEEAAWEDEMRLMEARKRKYMGYTDEEDYGY